MKYTYTKTIHMISTEWWFTQVFLLQYRLQYNITCHTFKLKKGHGEKQIMEKQQNMVHNIVSIISL